MKCIKFQEELDTRGSPGPWSLGPLFLPTPVYCVIGEEFILVDQLNITKKEEHIKLLQQL